MYSFPQCLHSFHIKDPAEFEFFLLGFLCPQGKYFRVLWLGISSFHSSLDYIFVSSPTCQFASLVHCALLSLTHCFHVRRITFLLSRRLCFLLLVAEHNPSMCFFIVFSVTWLKLIWKKKKKLWICCETEGFVVSNILPIFWTVH